MDVFLGLAAVVFISLAWVLAVLICAAAPIVVWFLLFGDGRTD